MSLDNHSREAMTAWTQKNWACGGPRAVLQAVAAQTRTEFQHARGHPFDFTDGGSTTPFATLPLRRQVHRTISTRLVERTLCSETAAVRRACDNASTSEARAEDLRRSEARSARPPTATLQADGLFVIRSPSDQFRGMSDVFACLTARQGDGGQPTNGRHDKSAAVGRAQCGWLG
jgi:hypothetical protein